MPDARIMVVEDEKIIALDLQTRLQNLGYVVSAVVSSGEDAIQKAREIHPDLTLMDIRLHGELDGVEAARIIRERFDVPVIYLTAYADQETVQRAAETGPYGYLLKPFEDREIRSSIEMALHRHGMEQRLRESERWLVTTLKSIGDAVIATDAEGRIKFTNPLAEALTGWPEQDALGREATETLLIVDERSRTLVENPITQALRGNAVVGLDEHSILIAKDGTEMPIEANAAPIRDDAGSVVGAVLVFRDITARRRAEGALRRYARELEERNEELDTFAYTLAHGLHQPLDRISILTEELAATVTAMPIEAVGDYLHLVAHHGRILSKAIDELLLLAQVRTEEIEVKALDVADIVARVRSGLHDLIEETQAEINLPDMYAWPAAVGYEPWVEVIWDRYLSHAIRNGGQPPRVIVGAAAEPGGRVRYWVQDNGPGLAPEAQTKVFSSTPKKNGAGRNGQGLGLSIARRLVEKLGGQVRVESNGLSGRGSVLSFTLPATGD
jgi:two-component system cell cycle sensor histidine kinase/response regulator CckA